jgi:hypothetical protein
MTRHYSTSALLWIAVAATIAGWGFIRLDSSQEVVARALSSACATQADLARIATLRNAAVEVARGRRPDADLVARAQRSLTTAGVPVATFVGIQPRSDVARPGSAVRVQTVQLKLQGMRPSECGAWLAAWRQDGFPWRVQELQLTHAASQGGKSKNQGLDDDRYDVTVLLAAPYLEDT